MTNEDEYHALRARRPRIEQSHAGEALGAAAARFIFQQVIAMGDRDRRIAQANLVSARVNKQIPPL